MEHIGYERLSEDIGTLAGTIEDSGNHYDNIYAIPRGGVPVGLVLAQHLNLPLVEQAGAETLVVDDLVDSGKTLKEYPDHDTAVLYRKPHSPETTYFVAEIDDWIEFPYEETEKDIEHHRERVAEYERDNANG